MSMPFSEITIERAAELIEQMEDVTVFESTGATVHTGHHEDFGLIHIVIPIAGLSILMVSAEFRTLPAEPQKN